MPGYSKKYYLGVAILCIAVKIVDDRGIESLKIMEID